MHRAWCCLEEVLYYFSRSCFKFQGHTAKKLDNFDLNWGFPDCNSSLNSPMARKWCTKLEVAQKRGPIVFEGHLSNFKVTRPKKLSILTQIGRFRTVTPVWIHWWLWNDSQSLKQHWRGVLLFFKVICQISRSHETKNCWFWPKLSVSRLQLQFEFTLGFEIMHKAWCSIEEVPYCFPRSSIKFQGHTGQNIGNFDPNWAFPDCSFSLNSPMALKWCTKLNVV